MSIGIGEGEIKKRFIPTSQQTKVRLMVVRTWWMVNPIDMRLQLMGISPMAAGIQSLSSNLGAKTAHSYQ